MNDRASPPIVPVLTFAGDASPQSAPGAQPPPGELRALDFARSLAVVIGIDDYGNGIPRLTTAANDARRLAQLLQAEYGYEVCLIVKGATQVRLRALFLEQLPAQVGPDDRLLVYFAGHGIALDGKDGPEGFLIPQDARPEDRDTFLPMAVVHEGLIGLPCRHLLAILDCCFAGAFRWSATRQLELSLPEVLHQERYDRFLRDPAWQVLTSAAYDQRALDILAGAVVGKRDAVADGDGQHSPFALALYAALAGDGDLVPKGGDGVITASELYLYLRDFVEIKAEALAGHLQTPGLWPLRRHGNGEYIFLVPGHTLNLPPAPPLTTANNPYRGLEPYYEADADLLFGRTELIATLAGNVMKQPLTVVLGASGTGKSSLVRAGLVPYLKQHATDKEEAPDRDETSPIGAQPAASLYLLPPMRPGDMPLQVLADLVATGLAGADAHQPAHQATPPAIHQRIADWLAANPKTSLLIVVDQFEELITLCRDDSERTAFLQLLADLANDPVARIHIVLTLRTDFEPQFADSPLAERWTPGRFIITPMTQAELREVITAPAGRRVLFFDPPELVDQLIDEVIQTPGALPLLSFTLSELYLKYLKRQEAAQQEGLTVERSLTAEDYRSLGGVVGSLRTRADEVYRGLDSAQQATMQRVMLRMVAVEGGELARRRVQAEELEYQDPAENERVQAVIDRLVAARLLVRGSADLDDDAQLDAYVEPAHDALVRAWDKLLLWKQAADSYLPLQRRLTRAAQEWERAAAPDKAGLLWSSDPGLPQVLPDILKQMGGFGSVLNQVRSLWPSTEIAKAPAWLNRAESAFITASLRRRALIRRRLVATTVAVILALSATAIVALIQRNNFERQAEVNKSVALASNAQQAIQNKDYDLAVALALTANGIKDPPPLAVSALAAAAYVPGTEIYVAEHTGDVTGVAFSPDGDLAVSGGEDQQAELWETATGTIIHRLNSGQIITVTGVAYSPTGETVLLGQSDGAIVVWDVQSGAILRRLTGLGSNVTALAFGADGRRVIAGDAAGALKVWDVAQEAPLLALPGHKEAVSAVAFSPDGQTALSGADDASLTLWNLDETTPLQEFEGHGGTILAVAFGPYPGYVTSGSRDRTVRVWNIAGGELASRFPLDEHTQTISSIAVAPGGSAVVSGALDGSLILWGNTVNGGEIRAFVGHRAPVIRLAYSADGRHVLSGSKDGSVRLWDVGGPALVRRLPLERPLAAPAIDPVRSVAIDTAHRRGLTGSFVEAILWDLDTGAAIRRFKAAPQWLSSVALSPDGKSALVGSDDAVSHFDLATGAEIRRLEGAPRFIVNLAYATDGQTGIAAGQDGMVVAWELATGQEVWRRQLAQDNIWSIALSADGTLALVGDENHGVILWDLATGQELRRFEGHQDAVYWVAISSDNKTVLTGSADRRVILWDLATGKPLRTFEGHTLPVHTVAYGPGGNTILSGGEDKTVRWWDIATGAELFRFEGHSTTVQNVLVLGDESQLVSRGRDGSLVQWQFPPTQLEALESWARNNRYVRPLTCDERTRYNVDLPCPENN